MRDPSPSTLYPPLRALAVLDRRATRLSEHRLHLRALLGVHVVVTLFEQRELLLLEQTQHAEDASRAHVGAPLVDDRGGDRRSARRRGRVRVGTRLPRPLRRPNPGSGSRSPSAMNCREWVYLTAFADQPNSGKLRMIVSCRRESASAWK